MPGLSPSDNNIVDTQNSTNVLLGVNAEFTGIFKKVTTYSSITLTIKSDQPSPFAGIQVQWSTDGVSTDLVTERFTLDTNFVANGITIHATVRAPYYRVKYTNGTTAQGFFRLVSLLRRGAPAGTVRSIDPFNTFIPDVDAQVAWSLQSMAGRANPQQMQLPVADDVNLPTDGPFIFVSPRPGKQDNLQRKITPVSLSPVQLSQNAFERATFISITNDVLRGNLYLQLHESTGLTERHYDYKLAPGEVWQDPGAFGSVYPGNIYGVWDEAYIQSPTVQLGSARYVVNFYG